MSKLHFLTRLRYDNENGLTDLTDNVWNNSKSLNSESDPFGGNSAFSLKDYNVFPKISREGLTNVQNGVSKGWSICCWVFLNKYANNNCLLGWGYYDNAGNTNVIALVNGIVSIHLSGGYSVTKITSSIIPLSKWCFLEVNYAPSTGLVCFLDGKKIGNLSAYPQKIPFAEGNCILLLQGPWSPNNSINFFNGKVYDFCIIDGVWHTEDYNVPSAYIKLTKQGLLTSKNPINLLDKTKVKGFTIEGIEPTNTSRKVAFKVDDVWNKINTSGALVPLPTQEITSDSVIEEGNTVSELEALTIVKGMAGKLIYPAVALYASEDAEVMPTFGMTVNAEIDTTVNVYSYTTYSQEYDISDGDDVPIISVVAETETSGNGAVNITARIKSNGEWSDYMSLNSVQMKNASAIQLKAVYTVQNTTGNDSAEIKGVIIKYNTSGAITSNSTTVVVKSFCNRTVYFKYF